MQPDAKELNGLQQELSDVASDPEKMADLAAKLIALSCAKQSAQAAQLLAAAKQEVDALLSASGTYNKSLIDVMKHLTTLATGVAVLLATFHEKFAAAHYFRWAIPIAFVCLLVSIAYGLKICMLALRHEARMALVKLRLFKITTEQLGMTHSDKSPVNQESSISDAERDDRSITIASGIANVAFFVALCAIGAFVLANK